MERSLFLAFVLMVAVLMTTNCFSAEPSSWSTRYCTADGICTDLNISLDTELNQLDLRIPELDRCLGQHSVTISQTDIPEECRRIHSIPKRRGFGDDVRGWVSEQTGMKITKKGLRLQTPDGRDFYVRPERRGLRFVFPF